MGIFLSKQNNDGYTHIMKWIDLPEDQLFTIRDVIKRTDDVKSTILEIENKNGDISRLWCNMQLAMMLDNFCDKTLDEVTFHIQTLDQGEFKLILKPLDLRDPDPEDLDYFLENDPVRLKCAVCMKSYEVYINFNFHKPSKHVHKRDE